MQRNIYIMYFIKMFRRFLFTMPIFYLFFNSHWFGEFELFIVQAVFAITVVIFEIPTWFVSDKYSRKLSLMIWVIFSAIWFLIYTLSGEFWMFLVWEIFLALGLCFVSGTDNSMIYDSLKAIDKEKDYKKVSGKVSSISMFAESVWWILWWIVWAYSLQIPFFMDAWFAFLAFLLCFRLIEPPRDKLSQEESNITQILWAIKYTIWHKKILRLIIFGGIVGCITLSTVWFSQPFMKMVELPIAYFGIFWFASNMSGSLFGLFIHRVEKKIWEKNFPYFIVLVCMLSLIIIALFPIIRILPVFFMFQFVRQWTRIISTENLHLVSKTEIRATIQSISSMFFRLCFAIFGPIFAYISTNYSFSTSFFLIAIVLGGSALFVWYKLQTTKMW